MIEQGDSYQQFLAQRGKAAGQELPPPSVNLDREYSVEDRNENDTSVQTNSEPSNSSDTGSSEKKEKDVWSRVHELALVKALKTFPKDLADRYAIYTYFAMITSLLRIHRGLHLLTLSGLSQTQGIKLTYIFLYKLQQNDAYICQIKQVG